MKQSDIHHISFHIAKSTVMLSVRESTTLPELREQLIPALAPLASHLSSPIPTDADDIQLWGHREVEGGEGDQGIRALDQEDAGHMTVKALGWGRWTRLFISFRGANGEFAEPQYTVPDPSDGDEEE